MKKILKNKIALLLAGALLVGFGGTALYLSKTNSSKKQEEQKKEATKTEGSAPKNEKGEGFSNQATTTTKPPKVEETAPTSSSTNLGNINSSVTAQKAVSDGSIEILFYLEGSGVFTSQEKSGSSWVTVKENQSYAGRGGFSAGSLLAGQSSKTMRVLRIENGKYTATTKEFTINRAEVDAAGGIRTYN